MESVKIEQLERSILSLNYVTSQLGNNEVNKAVKLSNVIS